MDWKILLLCRDQIRDFLPGWLASAAVRFLSLCSMGTRQSDGPSTLLTEGPARFGVPTATRPAVEFAANTAFQPTDYSTYINQTQNFVDTIGHFTFTGTRQSNLTTEGFYLNSTLEQTFSSGFALGRGRVDIQHNTFLHSSLPGTSGISTRLSAPGGTVFDYDAGTFTWLVRDATASICSGFS